MMQTSPLNNLRYCLKHPWLRLGMIVLSALLVLNLLLGIGWWGPARLAYSDALAQFAIKRMQWRETQHAVEMTAAYQQAQIAVAQMEQKLGVELNQAQTVQMLGKLAAVQKVRILSQAFDAGQKNATLDVMHVDLVVQGRYQGLRGMLVELSRAPVWMEVMELHMERAANDEAAIKCRMSLVIYQAVRPARKGNGT